MEKEKFKKFIKNTVYNEAVKIYKKAKDGCSWISAIEDSKKNMIKNPENYIKSKDYNKIEIENWECFLDIVYGINQNTYCKEGV